MAHTINQHVAGRLEEAARLLRDQGADPYRVRAYSARAHRAGKTMDWVVLYEDEGSGDRVHTVITAMHGPVRGLRVVAGREWECEAYYAGRAA